MDSHIDMPLLYPAADVPVVRAPASASPSGPGGVVSMDSHIDMPLLYPAADVPDVRDVTNGWRRGVRRASDGPPAPGARRARPPAAGAAARPPAATAGG